MSGRARPLGQIIVKWVLLRSLGATRCRGGRLICRGANFLSRSKCFVGTGATSWTNCCKMGTFEELRSNSLLRRAYLLDKHFFCKITCRGAIFLSGRERPLGQIVAKRACVQFIVEVL